MKAIRQPIRGTPLSNKSLMIRNVSYRTAPGKFYCSFSGTFNVKTRGNIRQFSQQPRNKSKRLKLISHVSVVLLFTDGVAVFLLLAEVGQTLTRQRRQGKSSVLAAHASPIWVG